MNLLTWVITALIAISPWLALASYNRLYGKRKVVYFPGGWLLIAAAALYPIARIMPEPRIFDETRTAIQHFIGGGVLSFVYYLYFKRVLHWKLNIVQELAVVFAFVSSMGALNEILEFSATKLGIHQLDGSDVWYDILANTAGCLAAFLVYKLLGIVSTHKN